jgi:hypothetical protein
MYITPDNLLFVLELRKSAINNFKEKQINKLYKKKRTKKRFSLKSLRLVPRYETEDAIWRAVYGDRKYSEILNVSEEANDMVEWIYEIVYLPNKESKFIYMSNQEIWNYNLFPYKRYFIEWDEL